ncbi:MAG TPA: methyltransferase domain-containing protein [Patescibacteria group bacterium]|nr:methyltransferase domain-containing protein [Patescibacteria group bacterium]
MRNKSTSWQKVAPWYNKVTRGGEGHYYHQHVVIPGVLKLLALSPDSNLLDLACGNGVLAKSLPKSVKYTGIDLADSLIKHAKNEDKNYNHKYIVSDITKPLNLPETFTHAAIILALQNIEDPEAVLRNASKLLIGNCKLIIVLNHPMFRIPRQSSWGIDEARKIQYRRVDKYMSPMDIPIRMNPSDPQSEQTTSYHFPLSDYSKMLKSAGFVIELIEEWTSDKESVGRAGRMENRSRNEIPLFMAIKASKTI